MLTLACSLAVGACSGGGSPDTPVVLLADGMAGDQAYRLEGRRFGGQLCTSLIVGGGDRPPIDRCGVRRTVLRHLEPASATVGSRRLVFSPLSGAARRVRLDTLDGSIRIEPARTAPGFPARFLLVELDPANVPVTVRVFGDGGRAVVA